MESPEYERQAIVDYMAGQAPDEEVIYLEKMTSERISGRDRDVWDVHTSKARWWVITEPTNLYSQAQFPSMDIALSFHVGLTARAEERSMREAPADVHVERYGEAWRKWEQAALALNEADEAEEFQAVGMRCRETLITLMQVASAHVVLPTDIVRPKAADVVGWSDVLGNVIAPGARNDRHRGYLKAVAKATWELVNWLTHSANANAYDAHTALRATEHALWSWSLAIMVHDKEGPARCPACRSYRLRLDYRSLDEGFGAAQVVHCEVCGWEGDGGFTVPDEPKPPLSREPPAGECITVDVPLRGPKPPAPRRPGE